MDNLMKKLINIFQELLPPVCEDYITYGQKVGLYNSTIHRNSYLRFSIILSGWSGIYHRFPTSQI